jgi:putative IMPACT (imprinted ancient) family translation regulator
MEVFDWVKLNTYKNYGSRVRAFARAAKNWENNSFRKGKKTNIEQTKENLAEVFGD